MKGNPRRKRAPTMADVARLAGVHRVTASVVLNNAEASTQVSEATRQRILDAAQELGYQPSALALALRRQRTDIIGFYRGAVYLHDPWVADVLMGLQRGCEICRKDLLLYGEYEQRSADEVYASLVNGKVDGLITVPLQDDAAVIRKVARSYLPVVAIADSMPHLVSVVVDDVEGSRLLAEHLARKGHRRILYRKDPYYHTSTVRRLAAFREAAAGFGMEMAEFLPGDWDSNLSAQEEACLLASPDERPTAAVCWADMCAYGLLDNCERLGIRVPDDLAVVGFDGVVPRIKPAYNLTTIRAPWLQVAEKAVEVLVALLEEKDVPQETVFPVELIVGDTT
jgi:DNA-binding LacI/PurR family transcriptional regulator